jgi:hypothetical protein
MNKLKITTGEWIKRLAFTPDENECIEVKNSELVTIGVGEETGRSYKAVALFGHTSKPEVHANADLMVDAGNTYQKCGLMPSELLEALKNTRKYLDHAPNCIWDDESVRTCGWDKIIELFERIEKQENETK